MRFDVITIFPDIFEGFMKESLLKRAQKDKLIDIRIHNLRDFATDKHKTVDDTPYGGGPGMVFKIEPIYNAIKKIKLKGRKKVKIVFLTPRADKFAQKTAQKWSKLDQLIVITGRYEGVDERVAELADESISIGDYVLLGGEIPAMAILEATARLVPGVVGKKGSIEKLNFPQYTKPPTFKTGRKKLEVPKVLQSGDHKKIKEWRDKHSLDW
jgi:tRNA (guanine37-N1)-methyltransferase